MARKPNPNPIIDEPNDKIMITSEELRNLRKDQVLLSAVKDAGIFENEALANAIYTIAKREYSWHQM